MRRILTLLLGSTALALPTIETAGAAASPSASHHSAVARTAKSALVKAHA
jgi:hypothetical protein